MAKIDYIGYIFVVMYGNKKDSRGITPRLLVCFILSPCRIVVWVPAGFARRCPAERSSH
jgi:hypothetical protein